MYNIEVSNGQGLMQQNSVQGFDSQRMGRTAQHPKFSSHCSFFARNEKREGRII